MNKIREYETLEDFLNESFRNHNLELILGSGFSSGEKAKNGTVPTGKQYKAYMLDTLKKCSIIPASFYGKLETFEFRNIAEYYENEKYVSNDQREKYYNDNFTDVQLSAQKIKILEIDWPYLYTLNIDDAIERNSKYTEIVYSNRPVNETIYNQRNCIIKLHGDVHEILKYKDSNCQIFTNKEYIKSLRTNTCLLNKLEHDYNFQNILFLGCSLSDELDFESLSVYELDDKRKSSKKIIIFDHEPDFEQENNLEKYGITDVLICDYNKIYNKLYSTWEKSKLTRPKELEIFKNIKFNYLSINDRNDSYFLFGKALFDLKTKTINIPYYFIHRNITSKILGYFIDYSIILIQGNTFSGKSYCLVDMYLTTKEKAVFYFDGRIRLNEDSFKSLLDTKNSIMLFDVGSVTREQFEKILLSSDRISANSSCFIFMLSSNSSDLLGIVKLKLANNEITRENIKKEYFDNKLDSNELEDINKKLPVVRIPAFIDDKTLLDNTIFIQRESLRKGKYANISLEITGLKDLELCILLATKEKLYSYDVIKFGISYEMYTFVNKYREFIDEINCDLFEKSPSDNSPVKYVLNAKFWLHTELCNFAIDEQNLDLIASAYLSIIQVIKNTESKKIKERVERSTENSLYLIQLITFFQLHNEEI
jgi:hypothetical protein